MAACKQRFTLAVQKFLEERSLEDLEKEFGVGARLSTDGRRFSLNYDQMTSKPGEIVDQCRGLILRPIVPTVLSDDPDWIRKPIGKTRVVAYAFNRFYNYGDGSVALGIDLNDPGLRVEEKVDGTLIILYFDSVTKSWCVATRSVPDADLPISTGAVTHSDLTFRKLFERAVVSTLGFDFATFVSLLDPDCTWIFELTSLVNKVVVKHDRDGITLLGCRSMESGKEIDNVQDHIGLSVPNILDLLPRPVCHPVGTIDSIVEFVNSRSGKTNEGVVLVDSRKGRVKVKNPDYVLASRSKDILMSSRRNMIHYILAEKIDDVMPLLDSDTQLEVEKCRENLVKLFVEMDSSFATWKSQVASRKDFAGIVGASKFDNKPFFELWEKKYKSVREHYARLAKSDKISSRALDHLDELSRGM